MLDESFETKYILSLLNSKLHRFLYENSINETGKVFAQVKIIYIDPLPVKNISKDKQEVFVSKADAMLSINDDFSNITSKFRKYLQSQFSIDKLPKKIQNWHDLEFGDFIKELNKAIKKAGGEKLTKMDEMEWMDVFETKKAEAQTLKIQIDKTDAEIDAMVYELYGLSEEEIKIIEQN